MARPVAGVFNVAMVAGLGAVRQHVPADLGVRPSCPAAPGRSRARTALGDTGHGPGEGRDRGLTRRFAGSARSFGERALSGDHQTLALLLFSAVHRRHSRHHDLGEPQTARFGGGVLRGRAALLARWRTDSPSPATTCRRRPSSASPALIALFGYDGMLYSVGFLVAWLVVLFLVAELVRNCGRFTLADVVAARMRERPVRIAAGTSSVTVSRCSIWSRRWSGRAAWSRCCSAVRAERRAPGR